MLVVFHSDADPVEPWQAALSAADARITVRRADEIEDPGAVRVALVWKPPAGFFARFPGLRLVVNLGAGVDALVARDDLPAVPITRLSDPDMARMMAGFVLFAVLRHARDIPFFEAAQREGRWRYRHPRAPEEIRVGVLGLGELGGRAAAELVRQGFDVRGWSRTPRTIAGVATCHGPQALAPFLAELDIVVVMLPSTPATRGLLDARHLACLPRGAAFVNVSRGDIVDEPALVGALRSGAIGAATLDVFAVEPLPDGHPFWRMPQVLVTPHLASVALPRSAARQIADNIARIERGEAPRHVVDRGRGY